MHFNRRNVFIAFMLTTALAACGGGNSVTPPGGHSTPTPTSSSSAGPTATPGPTASPLAAYCKNINYSPAAGGVPVNITDDSGIGATLVVYVENSSRDWLEKSGNFVAGNPNALPAGCFSSTIGVSGSSQQLVIPANTNGVRLYLAYAPPQSPGSTVVPNPFGTTVTSSGPAYGYQKTSYPWDFVELGSSAGATIDTSQVAGLGLPLEISVGATPLPSGGGSCAWPAAPPASRTSGIVGVTSCNFGKIFTALQTDPTYANYQPLVVTESFNGTNIDAQIVSPNDAPNNTSFEWDVMGLQSTLPSPMPSICPGSPKYGYLSCLINAYNTPLTGARLFQTSSNGVSGVTRDNYCVTSSSSPSSEEFVLTDVGNAPSCASAVPNPAAPSPNPFHMPIQEFTYGRTSGTSMCTVALLFSQPWNNSYIGSGNLFSSADAFVLWKGLTEDMNRGTMLTTSQQHPVGLTNPSQGMFFGDAMYNQYAEVLHKYFDNNLAYALPYDDSGAPNFASSLTMPSTPVAIDIRINAIPAASAITPSSPPVPVPIPTPTCGTLPTDVGTF